MTFEIGVGAGVLINDRDATTKLRELMVSDDTDAPETTTFHPTNRAKRCISGLQGGAVTATGYLPVEYDLGVEELDSLVGDRSNQHIAAAPFGFGEEPGNLGILIDTLQTATGVDSQRDGVVALRASWQATGGVKDGVILHTPHDIDPFVRNEQFSLVATAATVDGEYDFPDTEAGIGGTVTITPGDSASTVAAAIEALTGWNDVTVSGSTTALYGADVAAASTVTASGTLGGNVASNIKDGNLGTFWQSNFAGTQYVTLHLASPATIGKIRIYYPGGLGNPGPTDFTVKGSSTGVFGGEEVTLRTVSGFTTPGLAGYQEWIATALASKEYIRISISNMNEGGNAKLYEVQLLPYTPSDGSYRVEVNDPGGVDLDAVTTATDGWSVVHHWDGATADEAIYNVVTGTSNGDSVDNGAATGSGWTALLNVLWADGTSPTLDVVLEHSSDDNAWAALGTFAQKTDAGSQVLHSAAANTTVNRYVRAVRTIGGTNPRFIYAVTFARR